MLDGFSELTGSLLGRKFGKYRQNMCAAQEHYKSVIKVLVFFQQKPRKTPADGISLIRLLKYF
jgi:hypothetical protein